MATNFENLVSDVMGMTNDVINVGVGAAAVAAERSREVLDGLNAKGAEVRDQAAQGDFMQSVADAFERAGGTVSDTVERLSRQGATLNEKILDELIIGHARRLTSPERVEFVAHVKDLVEAVETEATTVPVDAVETEPAEEPAVPEEPAAPANESAAE